MKNRFNDEQLDEMFKTYYSRKAPYTFRVKAAPTNKSRHGHRNAVKYALSVVCVLLVVFTFGFAFNGSFVNKFVNNNAGTEPAKPAVKYDDSFIIKAYTAEISDKYSSAQSIGKEKSVVRGGVYEVNQYFYFNSDNIYVLSTTNAEAYPESETDYTMAVYPKIVGYHVALDIYGENIESFDISSNRGRFNYSEYNRELESEIDFDITPEIIARMYDNEHQDGSYDYYNSQKNIKYSHKKTLFWYPDIDSINNAVDSYAKETAGITYDDIYETCKKSDFDKYYNAQKEFFEKNSLNELVKDSINITIHYKNKSTKTVAVNVSLNDKGDFVLNYE